MKQLLSATCLVVFVYIMATLGLIYNCFIAYKILDIVGLI